MTKKEPAVPQAGWYPDPADASRVRYFDGSAWTGQVRTAVPGFGLPRKRPARPAVGALVLGAVLVILLAAGGVFVLRGRPDHTEAASPATPTGSAWDDSSPTASPAPSPSSTSRPTRPPAASVPCSGATADELGPPADDGRTHGGPLSFADLPSPWDPPSATGRFFFSHDSYGQSLVLPEKLSWAASAQVGVLSLTPYPGSAKTASALLQCVMTSDFYTGVNVRLTSVLATASTVDGTPATQLDAQLRFSHPDLKTRGSDLRIVVVDSHPVTYYFSAVPMERLDLIAQLDAATRSLSLH